jgi:hypothetical protein
MSGGLEETFNLSKMDSKEKNNFWSILFQAHRKGSIAGCSIKVCQPGFRIAKNLLIIYFKFQSDPNVVEARLPNGLVRGHA